MNHRLPIIKVVGMSASGKSTLVSGLRDAGYDARPVSQEHSQVPTLWKHFDFAHILIYLDVDLTTQQSRRPDVTWDAANHAAEKQRLANAREFADLTINTTNNSAATVLAIALAFLRSRGLRHAATALPPVPATGSPITLKRTHP